MLMQVGMASDEASAPTGMLQAPQSFCVVLLRDNACRQRCLGAQKDCLHYVSIGSTAPVVPRGSARGCLWCLHCPKVSSPGKAKLILKTNQAQGYVMLCSCVILQCLLMGNSHLFVFSLSVA